MSLQKLLNLKLQQSSNEEEFTAPQTDTQETEKSEQEKQDLSQSIEEPKYVVNNQVYTLSQLQETGLISELIEKSQAKPEVEEKLQVQEQAPVTADMVVN